MNASVDFDELKAVLEGRRSVFGQKYLVFLATENTSLINWAGQGHALRKSLLQGSDGVFGSAAERDFYLGDKHPSIEAFVSEFRSLKPCLQGTDSHELESIGKPVDGKFCWVKADTTFDGLRQVVFEPRERLYLGDAPPQLKHPYRVIKAVQITGSPDWFSFSPIPLNADLVSIIGGKGAGKSALSELIAFAGGSQVFRGTKARDLQETFLAKASKRSPLNLKTILGTRVTLVWEDGNITSGIVGEDLDNGMDEERVKYLPQKFVEGMCSPENHSALVREVERVIFHRIPNVDRMGASTFGDLRELKTKRVQIKKVNLVEKLAELNRDVFVTFQRFNTRNEKSSSLQLARKEASELAKHRPDTATASQEDLNKLSTLQARQKTLQNEDARTQVLLGTLDEIEAKFGALDERIAAFNAEIAALLARVELSGEADSLKVSIPDRIGLVMDKRRAELKRVLLRLRDSPEDGTLALASEIEGISKKLLLSRARKTEFEKYEKDRQTVESLIASLETEITHIDTVLGSELAAKRQQRLEKYLDYFTILQEEKEALDGLYEPLKTALAGGGETDRKLQFSSRITFKVEAHAANGCELFDNRRKGRYKDKEVLTTELRKLQAELETAFFDRTFCSARVSAFRDSFLVGDDGHPITLRDQLKRSKTEEDFNDWFYSLDPYSVEYAITFEGRNLSLLSPGQKGIVLLLVYLEVDQDDQRPLIIDQPEDNLDNLSVYSNLIEFFRKRKATRQILLVTHNPNLAVNTDSEQIIVATYEGDSNPRITYRAGALEETRHHPPGIREQVCAILEGGSEAFLKREEKYSLGS